MPKKKLKIAVLMGGPSDEHKVSLAPGEMVLKAMPDHYETVPVRLPKHGNFDLKKKLPEGTGLAFLALHGQWGEDGQVQELLEEIGIPYTGSDSRASRFAMNKFAVSKLLSSKGVLMPPCIVLTSESADFSSAKPIIKFFKNISFPLVVKPNKRGSSVGVAIAKNEDGLKKAIQKSLKFDDEIMIEKFIPGVELTCGVLDNGRGKAVALIPTEIVPKKDKFFDYKSKYQAGGAQELTPPRLPKKIIRKIQNLALNVHKTVGASGATRTDIIYTRDGKLHVLEINTIPGMTATSLLPKGAAAYGLNFSQLLDRIVKAALNRFNRPE